MQTLRHDGCNLLVMIYVWEPSSYLLRWIQLTHVLKLGFKFDDMIAHIFTTFEPPILHFIQELQFVNHRLVSVSLLQFI